MQRLESGTYRRPTSDDAKFLTHIWRTVLEGVSKGSAAAEKAAFMLADMGIVDPPPDTSQQKRAETFQSSALHATSALFVPELMEALVRARGAKALLSMNETNPQSGYAASLAHIAVATGDLIIPLCKYLLVRNAAGRDSPRSMMNGLFRIPLHRGDVLKMSGLATDLFSHCIRASDHSDALSASLMLRTLTAEGRDQLRALNQEQFKTVGRAVADEPAIREHGEFVRMEFDVGFYNGRVVAVAGDRYRVIYEDGDGEELDHADFVAAAQCFREARACGAVVEVDNLATAALYRKRDAFLVDD